MSRADVTELDFLDQATRAVAEGLGPRATEGSLAIVAGSGLGDLANLGREVASMDFGAVPGLGAGQVAGHSGRWIVVESAVGPIHVLAGRRHLYEGIEPARAALAIRVAARLGVRAVLLTNAAGGLTPLLALGDLMLIQDHLNLMLGRNPLHGPHDDALGPRFPDMSAPYDRAMGERLLEAARGRGVVLKQGVYAALTGPCYETSAEVAMLRRLGADAVGMSTVPEVLAARQAGLAVAAISIITNASVSGAQGGVTHAEVVARGQEGSRRLRLIIEAFLNA